MSTRTLRRTLFALLLGLILAACAGSETPVTNLAPEAAPVDPTSTEPPLIPLAEARQTLSGIAESYLVLELAMGRIDPAHVDAYFGPEQYRQQAEDKNLDLVGIQGEVLRLTQALGELHARSRDAELLARIKSLQLRLTALMTRTAMQQGRQFTFDRESELLYNAIAPHRQVEQFQSALEQIDALLPGDGPLRERFTAYEQQFAIPTDKLAEVFEAALDECRRRTLAHMTLPEGESFRIEYVQDKPWSGYNWYQGNAHSLIQVNTSLPVIIDRAVDLGCHEGYPGHHTYNSLLEAELVEKKGWVEYSLYPLFSPQSLIAEGSANYGIRLAFTDEERLAFEKTVLFPLAGLNPAEAERFYQIQALKEKLDYAGNEAARAYLDGHMDRDQTIDFLQTYALASPARAAQRVDFFDTYRSYVINYNLGRDIVAHWMTAAGGDSEARWQRFSDLLASTLVASDLKAEQGEGE